MKKNNLVSVIISCVFFLTGLGLFIGGIAAKISHEQFKQTALEITAVIAEIDEYRDSDGDYHHRVYVDYSYGGKTYEDVKIGYYSSGMYEGKELAILCDPQNPNHISVVEGSSFITMILCFMGIMFMLMSGLPFILMLVKKSKHKKLIENGTVIYATVEQIGMNRNYSVNGRHPYVVYCTYHDIYTDVTHRFKSDNLWSNPENVLQPGSTVSVYVESEQKLSNYYVDIESHMEKKVMDYT